MKHGHNGLRNSTTYDTRYFVSIEMKACNLSTFPFQAPRASHSPHDPDGLKWRSYLTYWRRFPEGSKIGFQAMWPTCHPGLIMKITGGLQRPCLYATNQPLVIL